MKNLFLIFSLTILFNSASLSQNIFQAGFSGSYQMGDHMSNVLSDGSIVFCYDLIDTIISDVDIGLIRIDSSGSIIWSKRFGGGSAERGYFPIETSDYCIVLAGNGPGGTILLTKIDINGNVVWSKSSSVGTLPFNLPVETHDKGFAVVASNQNGPFTYDTYLLRTDSAGNFLWGKSYGSFNTGPGKIVIETVDNGFLLAGSMQTTNAEDLMVIKTDSAGNVEWSKQFGSSQTDISYSASQMNDGGFLLSFNAFGGSYGGLNLLKLSSGGTIEWVKRYSNISGGKFSCITNTNEIVADGSGYDVIHNIAATVLIKTDSLGNLLWNRFYNQNNTAATLNIAPDSGYVLLMPNPAFDILMVVKTDKDGNSGCDEYTGSIQVSVPPIFEDTVILNVSSLGGTSNYSLTGTNIQMNSDVCKLQSSISEINTLSQPVIFPNPAIDIITIESKGNIKSAYIVDILGRSTLTKINNDNFRNKINISQIQPGVYILRIKCDEGNYNIKFLKQ